ncbi:MAG: hypothetical protein EXX96DRAFT_487849 [Benjaminiella poitrasii]|nr:MAG: hypothetical protein EXX96DRAFT_487849 [Benjaminiella poitrasii]
MITAVKRYFHENHNFTIPEESITTIPLEWEGKVLERVDRFYQQLTETKELNKLIKEADVILWATHSQGTPVSTILLRRLIDNKMIDIERQPVCMLAMAGIFYGPFPSIRGNLYFEADAARELFEFMDSKSDISIEFQDAISSVLSHAYFKIVLVGSMQDQVVPLYSSIMSGVIHPRILRAIYIDGELYNSNDFLIRLILFALKLLNLGLSDHGLLIHLSQALAGNFWQGEGHSTIYEEIDVFTLSLQYLFETSPFGSFEITKTTNTYQKLNDTKKKISINTSKLLNNPFHLPWAVRGIWDDRRIHEDERLSSELVQLQGLFDQWHPATTRLKEIKFRLEPLRARL